MPDEQLLDWLGTSDEPWTRYRTLVDLQGRHPEEAACRAADRDMREHPAIVRLIERAAAWPDYPLRRHNDAAHPLYAISTLADFGLDATDERIARVGNGVLSHFDGDQFETLLWLPKFLTKEDDAERWAWMLCDAPTLL